MLPLKITRIGSTLGIALPVDALERLRLKEGDTVYLADAPEGIVLSAHETGTISIDPALVEQLKAGHEFMRDFHATLRMLAP